MGGVLQAMVTSRWKSTLNLLNSKTCFARIQTQRLVLANFRKILNFRGDSHFFIQKTVHAFSDPVTENYPDFPKVF